MTCPKCGGATFVKDSRTDEDQTRRRRECAECKHRFSTVEIDADYYSTMKPRNKYAFQLALLDGYTELTKRLYRALDFDERNSKDEIESCT